MSGLAYLMGELASNKPDPNADIKKEIAAYARNPKKYMAQKYSMGSDLINVPSGKIAALNTLDGNKNAYDNAAMPSVIFTDPQVADTGLTEVQAKEQGYDVKTSVITLDHVPRFIAARDTRGLIKLVADRKTDKLLGAHILAPEGGDLIQTIVIALKAQMTTEALTSTIFPYLTGVEGLKLAAQTFDKDVSKLSCCAG